MEKFTIYLLFVCRLPLNRLCKFDWAKMVLMIFVLSPAKSLDFDTPAPVGLPHSLHAFPKQSLALIRLLRKLKASDVAQMMDLSDNLAALNVARYKAYAADFTAQNAKQALLAFDGDVYDGLSAKTLQLADLNWAQTHVRMLSGLYGVLRPLDWMQAYRLEMGTRLATPKGSNLYHFWGDTLAKSLDADACIGASSAVIVNLASQEYFKAVHRPSLKARVIECAFEELKGDSFKVISFNAKRARGAMARYAIEHRITDPQQLKEFDRDGYGFDLSASSADRWVFRRSG